MSSPLSRLLRASLFAALGLLSPRLYAEENDCLLTALKDANALVRKRAALVMGKCDKAPADRLLVALEKVAREDDDADVRAAAKATLEKIDGRFVEKDLLACLADKTAKATDRIEACRVLAERYWRDCCVSAALEKQLTDNAVKEAAARALEAIDARQCKATPAEKHHPCVAVINLAYVLRKYEKASESQEKFRAVFKEYEWRVQRLNKKLEACTKEMQQTELKPEEREIKEKDARALQRQIQDLNDEARRTLARKQGELIVEVYQEVQHAAARYARENDLDLVLHYNDAMTEAEANSPPAIERKVGGAGCCMPLYMRSRAVDISDKVLGILNDHGRAAAK